MPGPKGKTKTEREEVLTEVARLDRRGYTQVQIARAVKRSQPMVSMMLRDLRQRYREEAAVEVREALAEKLQQYREVRAEAWAAWERSKEDAERSVEEKALRTIYQKLRDKDGRRVPKGEKMTLIKQMIETKGRLPASEYLSLVVECLKQEARLLGVDDGDVTLLNVEGNLTLDWGPLQQPKPAADPVQERLMEVERMLPPHDPNLNGQHQNGDGK